MTYAILVTAGIQVLQVNLVLIGLQCNGPAGWVYLQVNLVLISLELAVDRARWVGVCIATQFYSFESLCNLVCLKYTKNNFNIVSYIKVL